MYLLWDYGVGGFPIAYSLCVFLVLVNVSPFTSSAAHDMCDKSTLVSLLFAIAHNFDVVKAFGKAQKLLSCLCCIFFLPIKN